MTQSTKTTDLIELRQAIASTLLAEIPEIHNAQPYDNRFDNVDINKVSVDPPELFVSTFGGTLIAQDLWTVDLVCGCAVTIVAKPFKNTTREKSIEVIQQLVYLEINSNRWGLDPELIDLPKLLSSDSVPNITRQDGVEFWVVPFTQTLRSGRIAPGQGFGA